MSRRSVIIVLGCALALMSAVPATFTSATLPDEVIIRITSGTPGHEIQVQGTYVYSPGDSQLHQVSQQTPFELKVGAARLVGIFGTASGETPIHVEMVTQNAKSGHAVSTATGKTVAVSTHILIAGSGIAGLSC